MIVQKIVQFKSTNYSRHFSGFMLVLVVQTSSFILDGNARPIASIKMCFDCDIKSIFPNLGVS